MNKKILSIYCNISLILAALISGFSFVAQKDGMNFVGPFTFNCIRAFVGAFCLYLCVTFFNIFYPKSPVRGVCNTNLIKSGVICGIILFIAFSINQTCMIYSSAGKAGFLTALYIVFVPIISVILGKKLYFNSILGVLLSVTGLYFLCYNSETGIAKSDWLLLLSAFFFALHIIIIGIYSRKVNTQKLSCLQFLVMGILSLPLVFFIEKPELINIFEGIKPILFTGIFVTAGAFSLQIFGQKATKPIVASLILSSEAVFAVLGGIILLGESLNTKEIFGCLFMIVAIVISQLDFKKILSKLSGDFRK